VLTQIYEVSTPGEARLISKFGIDHIGILFGNGESPASYRSRWQRK